MKTVVAALIEKDGKYLIAKRKAGSTLGGLWEFPGGKVEAGESDTEALEREIIEEQEEQLKSVDNALHELPSALAKFILAAPIIAIPIETREVDAAPSANAMGRAPSTVAKLVIKMGLNLETAASITAFTRSNASSLL